MKKTLRFTRILDNFTRILIGVSLTKKKSRNYSAKNNCIENEKF